MKQKDNVAFWAKSFQEEMEGSSVDEGVRIWALGGPTFAIRTPQAMVYLDPYFGGDPEEAAPFAHRTVQIPLDPSRIRLADAALISHEHYDHCHQQTLEPMANRTEMLVYGPKSVVKEMATFAIPEGRVAQVKAGDKLQVKDISVTVWPAYDAYEPEAVTYVLESQGISLFFGGDSSAGPAFDEIGASGNLDIAMLAFGRQWYMNEAQMLDAAERMHPRLLLPYHWELWRAYTGDILEFGRLVERRDPLFDVRILLLGDYLHYKPDRTIARGR